MKRRRTTFTLDVETRARRRRIAVASLIAFRREHRLDGVRIRDLIDDGRKW